jgi:nucleoid DNA-binding protein
VGKLVTHYSLLITKPDRCNRKKGEREMTKADLASAVAETGMTKKQAAAAVDAIIAAIKGSLAKGEPVRLVGFGTFSVKKRKARTGRNPRTGKPLRIRAKKVPAFSPGKGLKDAVS